jgi:cellulose synthase (UDP-forming)
MRRSALEAIGGVAQDTVTEDLHTTIKLVKAGYRVTYTDRPLAVGLSPATLEDYLRQRLRWGQGAMQVLRSKDSPLWSRHLSLGQRLSFIASTVTYFDGLQVLVLLGVPLVTLFTGLLPISTFGLPLVLRLVPYLALVFLANTFLGRGSYNLWYIERYTILRAFIFVRALQAIVTGRAHPFYVTKKQAGSGKGLAYWRMVAPHLVTLTLSLGAIAVGVLHLYRPVWYQQQANALAVVIVWTLVNITLLSVGITRLFGISRRARYRSPIITDLRWRQIGDSVWQSGHSLNLSTSGMSFEHSGSDLGVGNKIEITIAAISDIELGTVGRSATQPEDGISILLQGRVVYGYPVQASIQRVGITITGFASETSASNYAYLLHQPSQLLSSEDIFARRDSRQ